jgi:hypothetical protein
MFTVFMSNLQRDAYIDILVSIMECYDKFTRLVTAEKYIQAIISEKMIIHFSIKITDAYSFAHC